MSDCLLVSYLVNVYWLASSYLHTRMFDGSKGSGIAKEHGGEKGRCKCGVFF